MPTLEKLDEQILEQLLTLNKYLRTLIIGRPPITTVEQLSATMPYIINYKERKHVYIWLPSSALALTFEDYGTGTVQAQVWTNLGIPQGVRVLAPNNSTTTNIYVKCTDEVIA